MGGAMDIVSGVRKVLIMMEHNAQDGTPKLLPQCSLPLTGAEVVDRVITDLCVMDITSTGVIVTELADGVSREDVVERSGVSVRFQLR
jgi:3-oxoacid CoA-transferase subunit B